MDLAPLASAPHPIPAHVALALAAVGLSAWMLAAPKGTRTHRRVGWAWIVAMAGVAGTSLWIWEIRDHGRWSAIHALSVFTLLSLVHGVRMARKRAVAAHAATMMSLILGALLIAGAFTLLPGRVMHDVVTGRETKVRPQAASKSSTNVSEVGRAWQAKVNPASTSQGSSE